MYTDKSEEIRHSIVISTQKIFGKEDFGQVSTMRNSNIKALKNILVLVLPLSLLVIFIITNTIQLRM